MATKEGLGVVIPEILIPEEKVNLKKWAVVACDQYTSEPDYWDDVERFVGSVPSTLHMILPEAFLDEPDRAERIAHCKDTMKNYIEDGVLVRLPKGVIYTERTLGRLTRRGLMIAIDLDQYDYLSDLSPLIKATEDTVMERIPPRAAIRRGAIIECPHVMLLVNDPKNTILGPLERKKDSYYSLYDFDLMEDGGHLSGHFIEKEDDLNSILSAIEALKQEGKTLFAVGDGNHSLVTAKAIWEEVKKDLTEEERENHPGRFSLVEVVNLYDQTIDFKPIYRVVSNIEPTHFINDFMSALKQRGLTARLMYSRTTPRTQSAGHMISFIMKETMGRIEIMNPLDELEISTLQEALDACLDNNERAVIDYIHGDKVFAEMCKQYNTIGFKVTPFDKSHLFEYIEKYGLLPRKAFSIGEPHEKRYYLECRIISDSLAYGDDEDVFVEEPVAPKHPPSKRRESAYVKAEVAVEPEEEYEYEEYEEEELIEEEAPVMERPRKKSMFSRKNKRDREFLEDEYLEDEVDDYFEDEDEDYYDEDEELDFEEDGERSAIKRRLFGIMGKRDK